jgi:hypothetical protein
MARPSPYDPAYAARARILCRLGADIPGLARAFAVSSATLYRWLNAHPRLAAQVAMGKLEAEAVIEPTRYQRATGYDVTVERVFTRNTCEQVVISYKKRILADSRAAFRWLRLRRRDRWSLGEGDAWSKRKWPKGAPWQKQAKKKNDSQNPATIHKIMADNIAQMMLNGEITRPELVSLLQHLFSGQCPPAAKGDRDVSPQNTASTDRPSDSPPPMTSADLPIVSEEPHLIERPDPISPPQPSLARSEDQPERPVPHRLRRVPRGGHRSAARVRMIMADHPHRAAPSAPMRREQRRRVYLEAPRRVRRHIRGSLRLRDPPFCAV